MFGNRVINVFQSKKLANIQHKYCLEHVIGGQKTSREPKIIWKSSIGVNFIFVADRRLKVALKMYPRVENQDDGFKNVFETSFEFMYSIRFTVSWSGAREKKNPYFLESFFDVFYMLWRCLVDFCKSKTLLYSYLEFFSFQETRGRSVKETTNRRSKNDIGQGLHRPSSTSWKGVSAKHTILISSWGKKSRWESDSRKAAFK